ncbi:hypothetical protein BD310DRAFT_835544, partial [Dichomitus squalens]
QAIRMNILVNPTGQPHEFRAVDWVIELLNMLIKVFRPRPPVLRKLIVSIL